MSELSALHEAVRQNMDDDTPRLVFADWLDENYPNPDIRLGELPVGFNDHWHQNAMYTTLGVRGLAPRRGKWSNENILAGLAASAEAVEAKWAVRVGAAEIGGYPVLVSEPTMRQDVAIEVCRSLQWASGGCPVSLNRCARRGRLRLMIWFTAMPPEEQLMREVVDSLWGRKKPRPILLHQKMLRRGRGE
jgi:uncharacterized protein (TIGR02996 family)